MTVAQNAARIEEVADSVVELAEAVTHLLEVSGVLTEEVTRAHARLDKASAAVKKLRAGNTEPAPKTQQSTTKPIRPRKHATTDRTNTRKRPCNVKGNPHGDEQVMHNVAELNACWQAYHAAKAQA